LLLILQHADGLFPSGSFAFSQGLEAMSATAGVLGPFSFEEFAQMQIRLRWAQSDRVALVRSYRHAADMDAIVALDSEVEASTLAEDLRKGSKRNGIAFLTAHARLASPQASAYLGLVRRRKANGHLPVVQGLIWRGLGFDENIAVAISGYQALASLSSSAVRLGLIGAVDVQAVITGLLTDIREASRTGITEDQPLSSFLPLTEIALSLHRASGQWLFSN
jgi:urease accessory protein